jgi:aryl-alcohol dehydrogenase-like predicted oxidoreductase
MTASSPIRAPQTSISLRPVHRRPNGLGHVALQGGRRRRGRALVEAALEAGFNLLDTADIYGPDNGEPFGAAEALLGRVLAEAPQLRDRMVLASKGGIEIGRPTTLLPSTCSGRWRTRSGGWGSSGSTCTRSTDPTP